MKKITKIITLTAICMMAGMSLLKAENTINFINNWINPVSVHCKAKHQKAGKTRHDEGTITIPAGTTGNTASWNYNGDIEFLIFTDTVTNKSTSQGWTSQNNGMTIPIAANGQVGTDHFGSALSWVSQPSSVA